MAKELESLETDCAIAFARLFDQLKIGLNKQKEIITLVKEIARRDGLSTQEVMEDKHFIEIMTHRDLDRGQKSRKLRSFCGNADIPELPRRKKLLRFFAKILTWAMTSN